MENMKFSKKKQVILTQEYLVKLSKEELIEFIIEHKNEFNLKPKKHIQNNIDFERYEYIHVALRLGYCGHAYQGLVVQANTRQTVESKLFDALTITRLIEHYKKCGYTRCGRTDAGVSSLGNVVSLWLRKIPTKPGTPEYNDYCKTLNHKLPKDIRILGWAQVPYSFSARHSCLYREYLYYFIQEELDIEAMRVAAAKFVGNHNFINFCKKDDKEIPNYLRTIFKCEIREFRGSPDKRLTIYQLYVRGSSFLYHQIRCMMGVLYKVGRKEQLPSYVDYLLNISECPKKPFYDIASERPLILSHCGFEEALFSDTFQSRLETSEKVQDILQDKIIDYCIYNTFLKHFNSLLFSVPSITKECRDLSPTHFSSSTVKFEELVTILKHKRKLEKQQIASKSKKHKQD